MKNKYIELKEKHQQEVNEFPIFFAFSKEQLDEGIKKFGCTKKDLTSIGVGGFIKKTDATNWENLLEMHHKETEEARKDDKYLYQMFRYELSNHEYCITCDPTDTLEALGLEFEDIEKDKRLGKAFEKAKEDYLEAMNK